MKLLVTRRDGSTELLDIAMPITFSCIDNELLKMWQMQDAQGTDYYFNKDDGTYDGWGRSVSCSAEWQSLLDHAFTSTVPPKITEQ